MPKTLTIAAAASVFTLIQLLTATSLCQDSTPAPREWPEIELSARIMTGFEINHDNPEEIQGGSEDTEYEFFLQQARIKTKVAFNEYARVNLSAELSDALTTLRADESAGDYDGVPYLRNAYLNLKLHRAFQVRAGRFKRPISRLENRSSGSLPMRGRGLSNDVIIEDANWGDRAVGAMLWGKLKKAKLTWKVSLSNPSWDYLKVDEKAGVNAQARLAWGPKKWLSVGVNGGYMHATHTEQDIPDIDHGAFGGDVRIDAGDFYMAAEVIAGQRQIVDTAVIDPNTGQPILRTRDPHALGVTFYANYDFHLPCEVRLQPVGFFELADSDLDFTKTEAIRTVLGFNVLIGKHLRIMPQVELIRPLDIIDSAWSDAITRPANMWEDEETYYLLLQVQL